MEFTLTPIAFVHGTRHEATDDYWGAERAAIQLAAHLPDDAFDGLEEFSHAEILFVFDRLDPASVTAGGPSSARQ